MRYFGRMYYGFNTYQNSVSFTDPARLTASETIKGDANAVYDYNKWYGGIELVYSLNGLVTTTNWVPPYQISSNQCNNISGGSGGGAGGQLKAITGTNKYNVTPGTTYTIIVGAGGKGGVGGVNSETNGSPGEDSSFDTIISFGGSGGAVSRNMTQLQDTNKFGKGLNLAEYPQVISADPLKQTPGTRRNAAWNMIGKPLLFSPYVLPFSYPGFAARSKFYPESKKVTIDYFGRQRELGPQAPGGMTFADQPFGTQYADYTLQANRNYRTGRNFMIGAGLLGAGIGGASLYYNRDTGDMEVDAEGQDYQVPNGQNPGFGFKLDRNSFGRKKPTRGNSDNNYGLDSMYINNGDTINDKGWGAPAADYKYGGSHKKKFLKRMQQMFEPGGETQDPSLGKGSRMDNFNNEVSKKKNWVGALKKEADKVANEELYKLVQKSGDPKLINIFMGDQQQGGQMQQPMSNRQMKEGGDPCPDGEYWDPIYGCIKISEKNTKEYSPEQINDYFKSYEKTSNPFRSIEENINPDYWNQPKNKFIRKLLDDNNVPYIETSPKEYIIPKDELTPEQDNTLFQINKHYTEKKLEILRKMGVPPSDWMDYIQNMDFDGDNPKFPSNMENEKFKELYQEMDNEYEDNIKDCPCRKKKLVNNKVKEVCIPCDQAEEGGYVNMNTSNPLTRFVYGGDEYDNPDYYEPNDLIEARNGISVGVPGGSGGQYIPGEYGGYDGGYGGGYTPGKTKRDPIVGETYDTWYTSDGSTPGFVPDNRVWDGTTWSNGTGNQNTHNCDPGFKWVEEYQMCVPIMQTKYRPNIVPNNSGFLDNVIPWNRRKFAGYTKKQKSNPYYLEGRNPYTGQLSGPPIASYVTKKGIFGRPKESLDIYNVGTGGVELSQLLELAKQNQRGNRTNEKDKYRARIPKKVHEKNYFIRRLFAKDPGRDKHRASLFAKKAGRDGYRARIPKKLKD